MLSDINKINERLSRAREFLLSGDLNPSDYKIIRTECSGQLNVLEAKLADVRTNVTTSTSIEKLINNSVITLSSLHLIYSGADTSKKREIVSSIYPEKLVFDGIEYRTPRINEVAWIIYQINSELHKNTNGKADDFSQLSRIVTLTGRNSNRLMAELKVLAEILVA